MTRKQWRRERYFIQVSKHEGPQTSHHRDQAGYARCWANGDTTADQQSCTGSSSIVHEKTHEPLLSILSLIVETAVALIKDGHRVVIVSSGAIAVGLRRMNVEKRPKHLPRIQVGKLVQSSNQQCEVDVYSRHLQR